MEEKNWYLVNTGLTAGPYVTDEVSQFLINKKISLLDFVWTEGLRKWTPLYACPEFSHHLPALPALPLPAIKNNASFFSREKRQGQRVSIEGIVILHSIGRFPLMDISMAGVAFQTEQRVLKEAQSIEGIIQSNQLLNSISFEATEIRYFETAGTFLHALKFTYLNNKDLSTLNAFVSMQLSIML